MNQMIKSICGLLQSPDNMKRCAAAIIIAELAPKDGAVVKTLGETLQSSNQMLTSYILDAFIKIGSPAAVPYVMPLLDSEDTGTKVRAVGIISRAGAEVVPDLKARLEKAPKAQKILLVDLLARIHNREAFTVLLDRLLEPDFDIVKEACEAVRRHNRDITPKDQSMLHKQVVTFMESDRARNHERVLTSCLLLLGFIGSPDSRTILLKHAMPATSLYLRRHALIGLKNLKLTGAAANGVMKQVTPYLDDPDDGIIRHTLDIIDHLPREGTSVGQWTKLLSHKHPAVSAFAARQMAATDSAAYNKELLALLHHENRDVSEIAAGGLAAHKGALSILLDALAAELNIEMAWRLAKIIKPHSSTIDKKNVVRFSTIAARELQSNSPRHEALLYFLRNIDPKTSDDVVRKAAIEHKQAKRWAEAVTCLRRLINTEGFDDETRYALSTCNLKLSSKDLTPQLRAEDHALRGLQTLLHNKTFNLLDRLQKDTTLDSSDLHYVGFHFAEMAGDDKVFGEQLLKLASVKKGQTRRQIRLRPDGPRRDTGGTAASCPSGNKKQPKTKGRKVKKR